MPIALHESYLDQLQKISAKFRRMNNLETRNDRFLKLNFMNLFRSQHPHLNELDFAVLFDTVWFHALKQYSPKISLEIPSPEPKNEILEKRSIARKTLKKQMRHRR